MKKDTNKEKIKEQSFRSKYYKLKREHKKEILKLKSRINQLLQDVKYPNVYQCSFGFRYKEQFQDFFRKVNDQPTEAQRAEDQ